MYKAYKYRLYPTADQKQKIDQWFGICRLVFNLGLEIKIRAYKEHQKSMSSFDLCYQLVDLKKEFSWVSEVDSQALQASVNRIDKAFKGFFERGCVGYPKFKNKGGRQSFQCPNNKREIDWENKTLTIPKIPGIPIRIPKKRKFEGKIKTVTISRTPTGEYYASILVDNEKKLPKKATVKPKSSIGIDLGIKHFAVTSAGDKIPNQGHLKSSLKKLKYLQRRLRNKKNKKSIRRKKAVLRIAKLHQRIANQRKDFLHKLSTRLIRENQTIFLEDLNIKGMSTSAKGTIDDPGSNVKQKSGLNRSIMDASWSMFVGFLKYKGEWRGSNVLHIGRFVPSSKECSCCHTVNETLTLEDREWICANCGVLHDRDENAAKIIKYYGLKQYYRQRSGPGRSVESAESLAVAKAKKRKYILKVPNGTIDI